MARREEYDLAKIRAQVKKKVDRERDPDEFRPPKAEEGKIYKYRFFILPPFRSGEKLSHATVASKTMEQFFIPTGAHFVDNKRHGCPRVIQEDSCAICQHAFDLMKETTDKDVRSKIAKDLLPATYYMVNIFFPNIDSNPEEIRGRVKWYNCPKTVFDMWMECLYRDSDGGDPESPEAFGLFYDELAAYTFELVVKKVGRGNNYEKSHFVTGAGITARPIARGKDGKVDESIIDKILAVRHDLFAKVPEVNQKDIARIASNLAAGGEFAENEAGGFDADETKQVKAAPKSKGIRPPVSSKSVQKPAPVVEDEQPPADDVPFDEGALAGEMPVDSAPVKSKPKVSKPVQKSEPVPDDEVVADAEGESADEPVGDSADDEVDSLLQQLRD